MDVQTMAGKPANHPALQEMLVQGGYGCGGLPGTFNVNNDIGIFVDRCTSPSGFHLDRFLPMVIAYIKSLHYGYAATTGALLAEGDARTNNAATLMGNNAGLSATYNGGTVVPLSVRINGAIAAAPGLILQPWMRLYRLFTGPTDIAAGWKFAGGSVIVGTDPINSFANDVDFSEYGNAVPRLESSMAWIYNKAPRQQTTFTMSAIHYNSAPTPLVQGVTVSWFDNRCPGGGQWSWCDNGPAANMFPGVLETIIAMVRRRVGGASARNVADMLGGQNPSFFGPSGYLGSA